MVRGWGFGLLCAVLAIQIGGCGSGPAAKSGAEPDAAVGSDGPAFVDAALDTGPVDTVTDLGMPAPLPASCPPSLEGTAPFGCALDTPAPLAALGENRFAIYFPQGRVVGAPVLLAMSVPSRWELVVSLPVALDADGTAQHMQLGDVDTNVDATLLPGANGVALHAERFFPLPWDEPSTFVTAMLESAGDAPAPVLTARHDWLSPLTGVELTAAAPINAGTLDQVHVLDGAMEIPVTSTTEDGVHIRVRPPAGRAFSPARPMRLMFGDVLDVIGRVARLDPVPSLATDGDIADLTFATPPSADSIVSSTAPAPGWLPIGGGLLQLPAMPDAGDDGSYAIVLPLGSAPSGATRARVRLRARCLRPTATLGVSAIAIVNEEGLATPVVGLTNCVSLGLDPSLVDSLDPDPGAVVDLPGPGRLFLVFDNQVAESDPYSDVSSSGERMYFLDDITFE